MKRDYKFKVVGTWFCIEPGFLREGLKFAAQRQAKEPVYRSIRIGSLDLMTESDERYSVVMARLDPSRVSRANIPTGHVFEYSPAAVADHPWIERLILCDELRPFPNEVRLLTNLQRLTSLVIKGGQMPNYSGFGQLKSLWIYGESLLNGLDSLRTLEELTFVGWPGRVLPRVTSSLTVRSLSFIGARYLHDISAAFDMKRLKNLLLCDMPRLDVGRRHLQWDTLEDLCVIGTPWRDFKALHSKSLRRFNVEPLPQRGELVGSLHSLGFIFQLPHLDEIVLSSSEEKTMRPLHNHPTLRRFECDWEGRRVRFSRREGGDDSKWTQER